MTDTVTSEFLASLTDEELLAVLNIAQGDTDAVLAVYAEFDRRKAVA